MIWLLGLIEYDARWNHEMENSHIHIHINSNIIEKQLYDNNLCIITFDEIKNGDLYMTCDVCHCNYHKDSLELWLENHNTCPHCISKWENYDIYKNI